jgi:sugar phosphate isomerase/epimerase
MAPRLDRRRFVRDCAALSAGAVAAVCTTAAARRTAGIEPIVRTGKAKFKFSLAAYSYRGLLRGDPPKLTLFDFVRDCADMGLEGTELTSYYFPEPTTHDYVRQLKRESFRLGLDVSGTAVGNDFSLPAGPERQKQIDHVKRWIELAEILGAPVIRIFAGRVRKETSPEEAHRLIVAGFEECCDYAGKHGVHLALENHGGPTGTADGILTLVRDVKSPWFGVNLDTGNFHSEDVYAELAQVAPYAINVQVKVVVHGPDGRKQPADFSRLAKILRDVHYRGYIVLEYEEPGDPRVECGKYVAQLREAFEAAG